MEEEKKEGVIKAECPFCKRYQDCIILDILDKKDTMMLRCEKCKKEFLSILEQIKYDNHLGRLS